jgi:hypothetical protein
MVNMSDDVTEANEAKTPELVKPEGADFHVPLPSGELIWFRDLSRGQSLMLQRSGDLASKRIREISEGPLSDADKVRARQELIHLTNKRLWDAIDSTMVFPDDVDKVMDAMISGEIDDDWAVLVFNRGVSPEIIEDDIEEVKEVKPSRRANAKRTQVR